MQQMVLSFWNALHLEFTILGISFTLYDVFIAGCLLSIIGYFIGKILFFVLNER